MFGFGKKEKTKQCCCSGQAQSQATDNQNARIIVLGACCKKSSDSFANVQEAVKQMGISETVINIGDMAEIAKYGVMSTPALVIDNKVVTQGTLIKTEQATEFLKKNGFSGE